MKKQLVFAAVVAVGFALVVGTTALAKPQILRAGNLYLKDDGGISPSTLPKDRRVPISARIDAEIGTTDGSHPPALQTVDIDFDRSIRVNAEGLPSCREGKLRARPTADAKRACPDAIVGSGEAEVAVAFPDQTPFGATGPIVLFNGGVRGKTTLLLIHAYVSVPAPTAVVARVAISRIDSGRYGIRALAQIPRIAGGAGSVTAFKLAIDRKFNHRGKRQSYLTASCPIGTYLTRGKIAFADGTTLKGIHPLPCTPRP
jgi:hypothetical protein